MWKLLLVSDGRRGEGGFRGWTQRAGGRTRLVVRERAVVGGADARQGPDLARRERGDAAEVQVRALAIDNRVDRAGRDVLQIRRLIVVRAPPGVDLTSIPGA